MKQVIIGKTYLYSLVQYKGHKSNFKKSISKKFKKWFYFFTFISLIMWLMTSSKKFEQLAILKKSHT